MAEKYIPKTDKDKIEYLIATDERRERHIRILQADIKQLSENVSGLTTAIIGSNLNGNKGFIKLMETIETKVDKLETDMQDIKNDVKTAKYWGRGITGVAFVVIGLMVRKLLNL